MEWKFKIAFNAIFESIRIYFLWKLGTNSNISEPIQKHRKVRTKIILYILKLLNMSKMGKTFYYLLTLISVPMVYYTLKLK